MSNHEDGATPDHSSSEGGSLPFPPGHRLNWVFRRRRTALEAEAIIERRERQAPRWIITRDHDVVVIDGMIPATEGTRSANCTGQEDRKGWLSFRLRNNDRVLFEGLAEAVTVGPKWCITPNSPDERTYRLEYQDAATGLWTELRPPDLSMATHPTRDS